MPLYSLRDARCLFTASLAYLVGYAVSLGYDIALDEATERLTEKDPTSDHRPGSLHHIGLAADLLLYQHAFYLRNTDQYEPIGREWERYGVEKGYPLRWGGRFNDGNHFSWEWNGKK